LSAGSATEAALAEEDRPVPVQQHSRLRVPPDRPGQHLRLDFSTSPELVIHTLKVLNVDFEIRTFPGSPVFEGATVNPLTGFTSFPMFVPLFAECQPSSENRAADFTARDGRSVARDRDEEVRGGPGDA
jgi:hypothetical protein